MRKLLTTVAFAVVMLPMLATKASAGQFSIGIQIGTPPPPPVVRYAPPPVPAAGYVWVGGYYYPVAGRYVWHNGYWAYPPYAGALWVAPRYHGGHYYAGYWAAPRAYAHGGSRYYYRR
jgi:hypothetical protein